MKITGLTIGVVVIGIVGFVVTLVIVIIATIGHYIVSGTRYHPYSAAMLKQTGQTALQYPGSSMLLFKTEHPMYSDPYEDVSFTMELPKGVTYADYEQWFLKQHGNGWTGDPLLGTNASLSTYPDVALDRTIGANSSSLQISARRSSYFVPKRDTYTILQTVTDESGDQYKIIEGKSGGLILYLEWYVYIPQDGLKSPPAADWFSSS